MNGIENITHQIDRDTQAEIQNRMAQAQAQAAEIREDYGARVQRMQEAFREKGKQALAERRAQRKSMAQLERRKRLLAAKQQVIEEAFQRALERLCGLPQEEQVALLARLAASASETGREEVLLSPDQREAIGRQVVERANALRPGSQLTLGPAAPEIRGGLILRQGAVDLNGTFPMLLRQRRAQWTGQVAAILFPPEEDV